MNQPLNPLPYRHVVLFSSLKIISAYVFRKLRSRKYQYREYRSIIVDVLFL